MSCSVRRWRLVLILSFVLWLALALAGCRTLDEAPITTLWVIDTDNGICSEREITEKRTLSSIRVREWPLAHCDGVVGLSPREFLDLRTFIRKGKK